MKLQYNTVPIAFFDLDDTLTDTDTNSLWMEWRRGKDIRVIIELIVGLYTRFYYRRGALTAGKMSMYFSARTILMKPRSYRKMSNDFFRERGVKHIYADAVKLIESHKNKGIHTVIITGQDDFISRPFYRHLGIDGLISNRRIVKNNRFRGIEKPNCYAEGKIELAAEYASKLGVDLKECSFYSDSISDLPLLKTVKYPAAVNPDPELHKAASHNNWQIYRFTGLPGE